nr:GSCFA family protein [Cytophagales bacterium]
MEFRTHFSIPIQDDPVCYGRPVVTMGSCFSTLLGQRMAHGKMKVLSNPFGVIFNPVSVCQLIENAVLATPFPVEEYVNMEDIYVHYQCHSSMYGASRDELSVKLQKKQEEVRQYLADASHLFFTWGTSYVYEKYPQGYLVANCHKQPGSHFKKRLLTLKEMKDRFARCYAALGALNPTLRLVLTVSPVRHTKDGIPQNQLSKSLLRVLCHELVEEFPTVAYFPSYEWMMDDLRDYRFYKSDLIHPSELAEEYIWEEFQKAYFEEETQSTWRKVSQIQTSLSHKALHPESDAHQKFLRNLLGKMEALVPQVDFSSEVSEVKRYLQTR